MTKLRTFLSVLWEYRRNPRAAFTVAYSVAYKGTPF